MPIDPDLMEIIIQENGDFSISREHPDPFIVTDVQYSCDYHLILHSTDKEWAALSEYRKNIQRQLN